MKGPRGGVVETPASPTTLFAVSTGFVATHVVKLLPRFPKTLRLPHARMAPRHRAPRRGRPTRALACAACACAGAAVLTVAIKTAATTRAPRAAPRGCALPRPSLGRWRCDGALAGDGRAAPGARCRFEPFEDARCGERAYRRPSRKSRSSGTILPRPSRAATVRERAATVLVTSGRGASQVRRPLPSENELVRPVPGVFPHHVVRTDAVDTVVSLAEDGYDRKRRHSAASSQVRREQRRGRTEQRRRAPHGRVARARAQAGGAGPAARDPRREEKKRARRRGSCPSGISRTGATARRSEDFDRGERARRASATS